MTAQPLVTVIMPVRNEGAFIERSLGSVLDQDYPASCLEVVVVDGRSEDDTRDRIARIAADAANRGIEVTLLDNPRRTVPSAFNIALAASRGSVIVRVDGHCEIARDYVRRCVEALESTGADNVGGLQVAMSDAYVGRAIATATSSPFGIGPGRFHYATEPGWVDTVYLGAYRRDVFDRIGGFDEELVRNQDDEFNFRLLQSGGKIWLDPAIRSVYHPRDSLKRLWRQYFEYGVYKVRVMQKRGGVAHPRHLVPLAFVLALVGGALLSVITRRPGWLLAVAGPYALGDAIASVVSARRASRLDLMLILPLVFAILHVAYGTGWLVGLWRWRGGFVRRTDTSTDQMGATPR